MGPDPCYAGAAGHRGFDPASLRAKKGSSINDYLQEMSAVSILPGLDSLVRSRIVSAAALYDVCTRCWWGSDMRGSSLRGTAMVSVLCALPARRRHLSQSRSSHGLQWL